MCYTANVEMIVCGDATLAEKKEKRKKERKKEVSAVYVCIISVAPLSPTFVLI